MECPEKPDLNGLEKKFDPLVTKSSLEEALLNLQDMDTDYDDDEDGKPKIIRGSRYDDFLPG